MCAAHSDTKALQDRRHRGDHRQVRRRPDSNEESPSEAGASCCSASRPLKDRRDRDANCVIMRPENDFRQARYPSVQGQSDSPCGSPSRAYLALTEHCATDDARPLPEPSVMSVDFGVCPYCERPSTIPIAQRPVSLEPRKLYTFCFRCKECGLEWTDEREVDVTGRVIGESLSTSHRQA
jgi:hypothetical protein